MSAACSEDCVHSAGHHFDTTRVDNPSRIFTATVLARSSGYLAENSMVSLNAVACDFESQVTNHPIVFFRKLAFGRQVISDKDRVGRIQTQWLKTS